MATDEPVGRRVRLRHDAPLHSYLVTYLTDEQQTEGAEGVIVSSGSEEDRPVFDVKFENVPKTVRVAAADCHLIADL